MHTKRHQSGMSLIEVLTAVLIFSIGMLGLMGLQARATQFSVGAEDTNRAALLANEIATTMWTQNSVDAATGPVLTAWQNRVKDPTADGLPNGEGTVVVADEVGIGRVATITITWKPPHAKPAAPSNQFVTQVVIP